MGVKGLSTTPYGGWCFCGPSEASAELVCGRGGLGAANADFRNGGPSRRTEGWCVSRRLSHDGRTRPADE